VSEILCYIHEKFNYIKINQDSKFYCNKIDITKINCLNAYKNIDKGITYNKLNIIAYEIIDDTYSAIYYKYQYQKTQFKEPIYILIETNTGYINCNNNLLNNELIIYQGISQYDIENNTFELSLYLRIIDELKNKE